MKQYIVTTRLVLYGPIYVQAEDAGEARRKVENQEYGASDALQSLEAIEIDVRDVLDNDEP